MATERQGRAGRSMVREYIEAIVLAMMLALGITTFFFQTFEIPSGSMLPTLLLGDRIIVSKFIFGTRVPFTDIKLLPVRQPRRGEIVVFLPNADFRAQTGKDDNLIKRVVGLPGDTVAIVDKRLLINGSEYLVDGAHWDDPDVIDEWSSTRDNFGPVVVPHGCYFMMGDNRDNSYDSRFWGFVRTEELTGSPLMIYWSWDITAGSLFARMNAIRWKRIGDTFHRDQEMDSVMINRTIRCGKKL